MGSVQMKTVLTPFLFYGGFAFFYFSTFHFPLSTLHYTTVTIKPFLSYFDNFLRSRNLILQNP